MTLIRGVGRRIEEPHPGIGDAHRAAAEELRRVEPLERLASPSRGASTLGRRGSSKPFRGGAPAAPTASAPAECFEGRTDERCCRECLLID